MGLRIKVGGFAGGQVALTHYAADEVCRAHRHEVAQISLVLAGDYREEGAAGRVDAVEGTLTGKPAGFEHENVFGSCGTLILSVNLDEAAFLPTYFADESDGGLCEALLTCSSHNDVRAVIHHSTGVLSRARGAADVRPWLQQAHASLTVGDLDRTAGAAQVAGLHPATFAKHFRQAFGRPPASVRQSARLARALEAIIRTEVALSDVALDAGFADQAHMTRRVRRSVGLPPGRLRRMFAKQA
tara:strand:+ start:508 stop:1236 length:729 start_codon:yes stop_codon:yes gene_type:complete